MLHSLQNRPAVQKITYDRVKVQSPDGGNLIIPNPMVKSRKVGIRTWMRFDATGNSEIFECDKNDLLKRVTVPARDLRIMGPIFSQSSHILGKYSSISGAFTREFHPSMSSDASALDRGGTILITSSSLHPDSSHWSFFLMSFVVSFCHYVR